MAPVETQGTVYTTQSSGWYLTGKVAGQVIDWIVDTGSEVTILRSSLYRKLRECDPTEVGELKTTSTRLLAANGDPITVLGAAEIVCEVSNTGIPINVIVADIGTDGLIGIDVRHSYLTAWT